MTASTLVDLVKIYATNSGAGALTLGQAVAGYRGVEALTDGATYSYSIQQDSNYEVGTLTYLASGQQVSRSPRFSSTGGTAVAFATNAAIAFVATALDLQQGIEQTESIAANLEAEVSQVLVTTQNTLVSAQNAQANAAAAAQQAGAAVSALTGPIATVNALAGVSATYQTYAAANAAVGNVADQALILVATDETRGNLRALYRKVNGALSFVLLLTSSPRDIWVDPANGSDTTSNGSNGSNGTLFQPYKSSAGWLPVIKPGDRIRYVEGAVVRENWSQVNPQLPIGGIEIIGATGGCTMAGNDPVTGSFTAASGGSFTTTITHLFGYPNTQPVVHDKIYYRLMSDKNGVVRDYQCVWVGDPDPNYPWIYPSQAAADAFVDSPAGAGYFSIAPATSGGNMDFIYRVHPYDNDSASDYQWQVGQRIVPELPAGSVIRNVTLWCGVAHNGLVADDCEVTNVKVLYPGAHGGFFAGAITDHLFVANDQASKGTGYAVHHFAPEANLKNQRFTRHTNLTVLNWNKAFAGVLGCHGTGAGPDVMDYVEIYNSMMANCSNLGDLSETTYGCTMYDAVFNNFGQIGGLNSALTLINPKIISNGNSDMFAACKLGFPLRVINPEGYGNQGLVLQGGSDGPVYIEGGALIFEGQPGDFTMGNITGPGVTFELCALQKIGSDPEAPMNYGGSGPLNFIACSLHGIQPMVNGVNNVTVDALTVQGGLASMWPTRNPLAPIAYGQDSPVFDLGEIGIGATGGRNTPYANPRQFWVLTSKGIYDQTNLNARPHAPVNLPVGGNALNGIAFTGHNNRVHCFGKSGGLYGFQDGPSFNACTKIATSVTADFLAAIASTQDGTFYLLQSDGGMLKCVDQDNGVPTMTKLTTGISFPLLGGYAQGSTIVAWGSETDNSAGGVIVSTDGGNTFTKASSMGSTQIKCGGYMASSAIPNGIYALFGDNSDMWTATNPAGPWTNYAFNSNDGTTIPINPEGNIASVAFDTRLSRIAFQGSKRYKTAATQAFGYLDAQDPNPANWKIVNVEPPLPAMQGVYWAWSSVDTVDARQSYLVLGKLARWKMSERMANWDRTVPIHQPYAFGRAYETAMGDAFYFQR